MADANSMCYTYGRSKHLIKQRLDKHKLQYEKAQQALDEHMKNTPSIMDMDNIINMIHNLIEKDQYQLRLELERRKTMLRLDALEHRLIETFYELKPRQTEIKSAKLIWKAMNEQQNIIDEIAIFKKWLEVHTQASSYTLQDVQLPKINHIFISLSFQRPTSSAEHVAEQTIANAEQIVQYYNKIINNEKNKLQCTRSHHKNIQQLDQIIKIISQREHIKNIYLHLSPMAYQTNDTTETTGISSVSSDDELESGSHYLTSEFPYKDNSINENDWSSSDDSDNDSDDKEITYHHKETSSDKNIHWSDGPYLTHDVRLQSMTRFERRQACYYQEKLQQIRQQLTDENLILRPIYKDIGYHEESVDIFYKKVNQFMNQTSSYSFVFKLSRSYPTASQKRLANIVERVETTLNNLFESKSITEAQYMAMKINRSTVRMNYLYFVPDTHKEGIPVQPIMVCNAGPTMGISRYLGRLLELFFNDATHCKKFHKAYNVIHHMEFYQKSDHLLPTTLFVSFNINDLCLNFSHEQALDALEHFFNSYISSDHSIQGMTISTILQLVRLVLDEQYFIYNYKLYRQTAGSASGSSLTIPLVYIYLFYWQQDILEDLINKNELFFSWKFIVEFIWTFLEYPSRIHIGIPFFYSVRTSVYHKETFERIMLLSSFRDILKPAIKEDTWKWLRASFLKAIRYCSDQDIFNEEKYEMKW
ncbi:unnamed protein product [Rotaria sp. Silwood1]|nr:unnamed protein product [Rotaria sp. Silwood1]